MLAHGYPIVLQHALHDQVTSSRVQQQSSGPCQRRRVHGDLLSQLRRYGARRQQHSYPQAHRWTTGVFCRDRKTCLSPTSSLMAQELNRALNKCRWMTLRTGLPKVESRHVRLRLHLVLVIVCCCAGFYHGTPALPCDTIHH